MINYEPISIICKIGPVSIHGYSLMLSLAFIIGTLVAIFHVRRVGMDAQHVVNISPYIIAGSFLGSVLFNPILSLPKFLISMGESKLNWDGGYVGWGGFVGGLLFAMFYLKKNGVNAWKFADCSVPSLALAIILVKIGCFLNWCCYGLRTSLPWGINVGAFPRHPTQLYHAFGGLLILLATLILSKRSKFNGWLFLMALISYSTIRFIEGIWRDNPRFLFNLSTMQWTSLLVLFLSLTAYILKSKRCPRAQVGLE